MKQPKWKFIVLSPILVAVMVLMTHVLVACIPKPLAIFNTNICPPPCWEGIKPGETTLLEAKAKLQTSGEVDVTTITPRSIMNSKDSVNFEFHSNLREVGGYVFSQGELVEGIWFGYDSGGIKFSEVLQNWGSPDQYISTYQTFAEVHSLVTSVIYKRKGIILTGVTIKDINEVPRFENDYKFDEVWFTSPENITEFMHSGPMRLDSKDIREGLKPWTGLGEIHYITKDK
jgi:hypothetical protein